VELVPVDVDFREFLVGHLPSGRIGFCVDLRMDQESGTGGCGSNKIDNNLVTYQGFATPVLAYEGEQAMFDLVPFAGSWGKMADLDVQSGFISQFL
jgi:hypothetical protein